MSMSIEPNSNPVAAALPYEVRERATHENVRAACIGYSNLPTVDQAERQNASLEARWRDPQTDATPCFCPCHTEVGVSPSCTAACAFARRHLALRMAEFNGMPPHGARLNPRYRLLRLTLMSERWEQPPGKLHLLNVSNALDSAQRVLLESNIIVALGSLQVWMRDAEGGTRAWLGKLVVVGLRDREGTRTRTRYHGIQAREEELNEPASRQIGESMLAGDKRIEHRKDVAGVVRQIPAPLLIDEQKELDLWRMGKRFDALVFQRGVKLYFNSPVPERA